MVHKDHHINYIDDTKNERNKLDIYYSTKDLHRDVLIFVYGNGNKNIYKRIGRNFVRKGLVTVIINYSLSSNQIHKMAEDYALAIIWVYQNILKYGGNPNRIFLMGHSIGGHLVELINCDRQYFRKYNIDNPIKGIILLDAFGLDIYEYLNEPSSKTTKDYKKFLEIFSNDPQNWKQLSPMKYLKNIKNPHLILIGEKTSSLIQNQNRHLFGRLTFLQQAPAEFYEIPRRKDSAMILHMFLSKDKQYDIIVNFIGRY